MMLLGSGFGYLTRFVGQWTGITVTQCLAMVIQAEITSQWTSPQILPSVACNALSYSDGMTEIHYAKTDITKHFARAKRRQTAIFETNKRVYFTATRAYLGAKMSSRLCRGKIKCDHVYFSSA